MKEIGIILDFGTNQITLVNISRPMRHFCNLQTKAVTKRAWMINNSIYQDTSNEPASMLEATKCLIHTLDAKYEKKDLRAIVKDNCMHLSVPEQKCYWSSYKTLRSYLTEC